MKKTTADKKRNLIRCLLQECTREQNIKFTQIFGSLDTMDEQRLPEAVRLCTRTVEKNFNGGIK